MRDARNPEELSASVHTPELQHVFPSYGLASPLGVDMRTFVVIDVGHVPAADINPAPLNQLE